MDNAKKMTKLDKNVLLGYWLDWCKFCSFQFAVVV